MSNKPLKGKFIYGKRNHPKNPGDDNLGHYWTGVFINHPFFAGRHGHTSMAVHEIDRGDYWEVETLNSVYHVYEDGPQTDLYLSTAKRGDNLDIVS